MAEASKVYAPPVIEHSDWDDAPERVLLFSISRPGEKEGDEPVVIDYSMPGKAHPGLSLAFLKMARTAGVEIAMSWLLEQAVGVEGYEALCAEPGLTSETLASIMKKAQTVILGGLEAPKD